MLTGSGGTAFSTARPGSAVLATSRGHRAGSDRLRCRAALFRRRPALARLQHPPGRAPDASSSSCGWCYEAMPFCNAAGAAGSSVCPADHAATKPAGACGIGAGEGSARSACLDASQAPRCWGQVGSERRPRCSSWPRGAPALPASVAG